MAKANRAHGKTYYVSFAGQNLSVYLRSFKPGREYQTYDGTAAGDDLILDMKLPLEKIEPEAEFIIDRSTAGQAVLAVLEDGYEGELIWGPFGNSAGMPKYGIDAWVMSGGTPEGEYKGEMLLKIKWRNHGSTWLFDNATMDSVF